MSLDMLSYRLATSSDIKKIVTLIESAYRGESSRQGWTTEADFINGQRTDDEEVSGLMTSPNNVFLLCENKQQLVASVQLSKTANQAYLGMFAVDPLIQGKGAGKSLLQQAEHFVIEQWQSVAMKMTVITIRKELISWYLRHGYIKTGELKPFPYEEPRFGIPIRDDLVLETLEKRFVSS